MLSVVLLLGLSLSVVDGVRDININDGNFRFIYHDFHNLLLTLYSGPDSEGHHVEACYYTVLDKDLKDELLGQYRSMIEKQVENTIRLNEKDAIAQTSLSEMRDLHQDLLADYHCQGKDVYTLEVDYLQCTFDIGLCAWTQSYKDRLEWLLHSGSTITAFTGPDRDHTNPTGNGKYLYLEANDGQEGDTADLESPEFTLTKPMCFEFWYFMYGASLGELQVYKISDGQTTFLFNLTQDRGQSWRKAEIPLQPQSSSGERIQLGFRATRGNDIYGDIAIDDVSGSPGVCTAARISCDFEKPPPAGFCGWHVGETSVIDWRLHRGPTETTNTGPETDHTVGKDVQGQYLYMESNDGRPQDQAILVSPVLQLDEPICMEFWYHMKGGSVGQLAVFVRDVQTNIESIVWSASRDQGNEWLRNQLSIIAPQGATYTQIVFRATRGDSIESDIAIDDIMGTPGPCVNLQGGLGRR